MRAFWTDLRTVLRSLRARPGFTTLAAGTLALGIGGATAVFSVVNAALVRPLPVGQGDELVRIYEVPRGGTSRISVAGTTFRALEEGVGGFAALVGHRFMDLAITTDEGPARVAGVGVTNGWIDALGVEPEAGRGFSPDEYEAGLGAGVVVIGEGLRRRLFGDGGEVLGRVLTVDGRPLDVVGVMPPSFRFPYETEVWLPMNARLGPTGPWSLNVQARLAAGTTLSRIQAELDAVARRLAEQHPEVYEGTDLLAVRTREVLVGDQGNVILALQGAVAFLLLIVCANLVNLLLVRAVGRRRELAVRRVLGAGRLAQARGLVVEGLVLAFLGGLAGVALAAFARPALRPLLPGRLAWVVGDVPVDFRVVAFSLALAVTSGVICGLVPAWRMAREAPFDILRGGPGHARGPAAGRAVDGLVIAEVALAVVLVSGAVVLARAFDRAERVDLGYNRASVVTLSVSLHGDDYQRGEGRLALVRGVLANLRSLQGVVEAGTTSTLPLPGANFLSGIEVEGFEAAPGEQLIVNARFVSPGYFRAMGIPLLAGRPLSEADDATVMPVAVISRAMADRFWPGQTPVGKRVRRSSRSGEGAWVSVVGVVDDVWEQPGVRETWYLAFAQNAGARPASEVIFTVRFAGQAAPGERALRGAVREVDSSLPVYDVATVDALYRNTLSGRRMGTRMAGGFAFVGLLLAALGVYGVLAFIVAGRAREIGVRVAVGASRVGIAAMVIRRALRLGVVGLVVGSAGAVAVAHVLAGTVVGVDSVDVSSLVVAGAVLLIVAAAAAAGPAVRAARVDPVAVLRAE